MSVKEIKNKLSECYKKNKPVLLYGNDSINRFELILDIHINNGGITDAVEYNSFNDEPDGNVFLERMVKEIEKAEIDATSQLNLVPLNIDIYDCANEQINANCDIIKENIYNKVREAFESTEKTWLYHNCEYANSVYKNLTARGDWHHFEMKGDPHNEGSNIAGRYLYDFKGSLFLDNLKFNASNNRDIQHYCKFGMEIRDKNLSVNWLVAYVHSLDGFPEIFLNQFEPISLDGENAVVVPAPETAILGEPQEVELTLQDDLLKDTGYKQGDNGFIKKADYWIISYEGKTIQLTIKGNVGLEYIARLLDNRGSKYESHKLRNMLEHKTPIDIRETIKHGQNDEGNKEDTDEFPKEGPSSIRDGIDIVLDDIAKKEFNDELNKLNRELKTAKTNNDFDQADKIQEEINFITKQMVADLGLKDRPRRV